MFLTALLTIAKNSKQPEYPSVAKETNNSVRTTTVHHTVEYYSAMKRNGLLIHAITWMNLEIIMLSERSQTKKEDLLYDSVYIKF